MTEIDVRWIDSIANTLATTSHLWHSSDPPDRNMGYGGDPYHALAREVRRGLISSGFQIFTVGQDIYVDSSHLWKTIFARYQHPRFYSGDYDRDFAVRVINEIRNAGLEIRPV
jgi:hypothetical protein